MSKAISILGLVAAVGTALAGQLGAINPKYGLLAMGVAAVASAAGGALTRYLNQNVYVTATGVIIAVAGALAGFTDVIGDNLAQVVAILGTAAAAVGGTLWPNLFGGDSAE